MFKVALSYFFRLKIYTNRSNQIFIKVIQNVEPQSGYIYVSNTNALKLYNFTIKKKVNVLFYNDFIIQKFVAWEEKKN